MWGVWQSVSIITENIYCYGEFERITNVIRYA
jgi:hypothetical protein